jgi:hypothetical protein
MNDVNLMVRLYRSTFSNLQYFLYKTKDLMLAHHGAGSTLDNGSAFRLAEIAADRAMKSRTVGLKTCPSIAPVARPAAQPARFVSPRLHSPRYARSSRLAGGLARSAWLGPRLIDTS